MLTLMANADSVEINSIGLDGVIRKSDHFIMQIDCKVKRFAAGSKSKAVRCFMIRSYTTLVNVFGWSLPRLFSVSARIIGNINGEGL